MASHTKCGVSDHEHKSSCGAAVRRRHQRGSSWQLTTATTSSTSACQCTPSSMAAGSSIGSTTTNAATMDGRFRWLTKWTFVGALSTLPSASPMESGHRNYISARGPTRRTRHGRRLLSAPKDRYAISIFWSLRFTYAVGGPTLYRPVGKKLIQEPFPYISPLNLLSRLFRGQERTLSSVPSQLCGFKNHRPLNRRDLSPSCEGFLFSGIRFIGFLGSCVGYIKAEGSFTRVSHRDSTCLLPQIPIHALDECIIQSKFHDII